MLASFTVAGSKVYRNEFPRNAPRSLRHLPLAPDREFSDGLVNLATNLTEECNLFQVDPQCSSVLAGFDDGVVRVLTVQKSEDVDQYGRRVADKFELILKHVLKPHKANISAVCIDSRGELLATGVSFFSVFNSSVSLRCLFLFFFFLLLYFSFYLLE